MLDFVYILLFIFVMIFTTWAQNSVRKTYQVSSALQALSGLTGAEVAERILRYRGIFDVTVQQIEGVLTDNYNPRTKTVSLSPEVYNGNSLAAYGIAAHEVGHVMQYHEGYAPIRFRTSLVPVVQLTSAAAMPLLFLGLFLQTQSFVNLGLLFFIGVVIFQLVTLPVEFDASRRAVMALSEGGFVQDIEMGAIEKVLSAAAMTYVASAMASMLQLMRLFLITRNSRRR